MTKDNTRQNQPPEGPQGGESQTQSAAPAQSTDERPSYEEYKSEGKTVVKTRRGHRVIPTDTSLPIVDYRGVNMSKDKAEKVVEEFPDYAFIADGEEE